MRGTAVWLLCAVLTTPIVACASSKLGDDAAVGGDDAALPADAMVAADAGVDAPVATAPPPGAEVVSAGGTVRLGPVSMDVEIGHFVDQTKVSSGTRTLEGAAVIKQ